MLSMPNHTSPGLSANVPCPLDSSPGPFSCLENSKQNLVPSRCPESTGLHPRPPPCCFMPPPEPENTEWSLCLAFLAPCTRGAKLSFHP